ncbi:MAG: TonB-dependent receptor [Ignavibacteriaceae bacterium]|nr:TonB-dependent receptor [Ignavibacteriaceae bacterium]
MKKLSLLFIFLFCSGVVFAQGTGALRGFVTDSLNGEAIIFANVFIEDTNIGSPSDTRGYYYIPQIPAGERTIIVSYIGYATQRVKLYIKPGEITQFNFRMVVSGVELEPVSVVGQKTQKQNETNIGMEQISLSQIKSIPAGVEADVLRAIKFSAGVSSTGDVTSRYYVRGGGSDQNMVLLNSTVIYNPFHALGIFSVIDPEIIKLVEFYKGGFTSEYGGRLSSIMNIITRDGNKNSFQASAAVSTLSGKASIEGPIPYGSFLFTGRKSYRPEAIDKFLKDRSAPFDFYDFSFKINYANPEIYENGNFTLHGFFSKDEVKYNNIKKEDYYFENNAYGLNWYQVWASPLYSYMTFTFSNFTGEVIPNETSTKPRKNIISDISSNWDFHYMYDSKDELVAGFYNKLITSELKMENLFGSKTDIEIKGLDMIAYLKYKLMRYENLGVDAGVRINLVSISKRRPFLFEPRVSFTFLPLPAFTFKAAVGRYSQTMTTLSNEDELISIFEPYIIIPGYVKPSEATHYIVGIDYYLTDKIKLMAEGYLKTIDNLIDINELKYTSDDPDFVNVDGESYGIELSLDIMDSWFFFKTNYALSYAYKIKDGVRYFPRYDARHTVNVTAGVQFWDGWQFNAAWRLSTGLPYTSILGFYDKLDIKDLWSQWLLISPFNPAFLYGERNIERLPVYHRLDLSISKKFELFFMKMEFDLSVINLYDRKNIFYFEKDTGERVDMLPFLPSASLRIEI